ncbi:hypothetical protein DPMN_128011 [Dreissena polymorpha]|uniref:Receptor ligand binding region domain-containing protein n=1 Tax=Dreissena polymorpha TaxID=45954 RepID=A0A9D4H019_DREPO|nr:hypothetical protein DPMN_128011 [Dreissena polymorpha]
MNTRKQCSQQVKTRVQNAPPSGSHVFQPTGILFKLAQDIIGMNLPTKFHDDRKINVASTTTEANTSPDLPQLRKHNITFDFIMADTHCDIGQGLYQLVEMNPHVNAYIGPACDAVCLPAGLLAAKWDKPMISYSCSSRALSNHGAYKTFARTTAIYVDMLNFLVDILHHFKWDRIQSGTRRQDTFR